MPEIASRAHLDLLNPMIARAIVEAGVPESRIDAVACTIGPGLIGALLVGVSAAKAFALAWDVPFIGVNHLEAHLYAAFLEDPTLEFPLVVLLVSGGHTMLIEMRDHGQYRLLGRTIDDAAGEAFDKVARFLGLGYPGGPAIDREAMQGDPEAIKFPRAMLNDGLDFSFSGLKTSVINHVRKHPDVSAADVAASFQAAVVDVLVTKARRAARAGRRHGAGARWRRRGQLVAARALPRRLRRRWHPRLPAQPGDVHRQRGDDRRRRLVPAAQRRPDAARLRRLPQPAHALAGRHLTLEPTDRGAEARRYRWHVQHAVQIGSFTPRRARGAGADGGCHQRAVPHDVPSVRAGPGVRERDGDGHGRRARQRRRPSG